MLFVGALVIPTVIALLTEELPVGERAAVVALALGLVLWHWVLVVRRPEWSERTGLMVGYWLGTSAFATALAGFSGAYSILLYGLYPMAFMTLHFWGVVPVAVVTTLIFWRFGAFDDGAGDATVSVLGSTALSLLVAVVFFTVARESEMRREALDALAATRAELAETSRRAGVLEERQRLARELHDTVAQGFTSIVTHLEAADQALDAESPTTHLHLDTARQTARDGLTEVRRTVAALRPDLLEGASLGQALERTARRWSAEHGLAAELRTTGDPVALHPDTETALLRTAQEALTNVARHAGATRAVVTLSYLGDTVTLDVDDDGAGFAAEPAPRAEGGFGLPGMRERIAAVGGRLDVESAPGEGTTVAATVPA